MVLGGDAVEEDVGLVGELIVLNQPLFFDFEGDSNA
jgi:hypothetical protein